MLSVRATAERAVDVAREDALNTARREIERKFNERAAGLQDKLVDVAINLDQEGSMAIAGIFATKLCVKCGNIDESVVDILKPEVKPYHKHNNEMVLEICYSPGQYPYGGRCPAWIQKMKGCGEPGCKEWYHVATTPDLNEAFSWTRGAGAEYGATLRLTKLSQEQVDSAFHPKLRNARVLLLVDGVEEMEEPTTQLQRKQRVK